MQCHCPKSRMEGRDLTLRARNPVKGIETGKMF